MPRRKAPEKLWAAVDSFGTVHVASAHREFVLLHCQVMRRTHKLNLKLVRYGVEKIETWT